MSDLTRTLGFKTTEPFFQQVVSVAEKQGLTKSDFVRNAVQTAVDKPESNSITSFIANPVITPKPVIDSFGSKIKSDNFVRLIEYRNKELATQVVLCAGLAKMLKGMFLLK